MRVDPPNNPDQADNCEPCKVIVAFYGDLQNEQLEEAKIAVETVFFESGDDEKGIFLDMMISLEEPIHLHEQDAVTVRLTPKAARSIAYSLLWYANDLEGRERPRPRHARTPTPALARP